MSMAFAPMAQASVCGIDDVTYDSIDAAEAAGVETSYEFACETQTTETGMYEAESDIHFVGMLIEVGSTDVPTNLIIRKNGTSEDYTVSITADTVMGQRRDQVTVLSDWIPGDQIRVIGKKNENTGYIEASIVNNHSITNRINRGANGWITKIDKENKEVTYQWANKEHTFKYDENTRFVAGLKNPASVDDLEINDRIRGRLLARTGDTPMAKIVIVLRRGEDLFMKIRTFRPHVTLVRLDSAVVPTTIQVRIDPTPGLRKGDVNNLVGTEGDLVTLNITEDTKIVRKYFGKATLDEFSIGDKLQLIGRANDDGTLDVKVVKNNSIWRTNSHGYAGVVAEVNQADSYLMVNWTPVKKLTQKKLKEKLKERTEIMKAQAVEAVDKVKTRVKTKIKNSNNTRLKAVVAKVKKKVKTVKEKVGKLKREIKTKVVKITRIKKNNVRVKDLVERLPSKKIKVKITNETKVVVGTNTGATIADIQKGDKVRVRGVMQAGQKEVLAHTVVVVSSLPEIEADLEDDLDEVNEIVTEIVATSEEDGNEEDNLIDSTVSDTEEEINDEGEVVEVVESEEVIEADTTTESVTTDEATETATESEAEANTDETEASTNETEGEVNETSEGEGEGEGGETDGSEGEGGTAGTSTVEVNVTG